MAKFDLAAKLKEAASNLNTGAEQIEYLPFELLDPDESNFYSLDGLDELADSIATVGILTPLRVRQNGERYTITSGHRRRAAVQLLIDSGEDWSRGLPCIVDRGEETPEWTELKLIFSNRQRVKNSAELSREAERTNELLCALREKGYEFPGRMQEHVAQALGVKASKLKRLHAIRANLVPELLALYDANTINEETAYQLQQLPEGVQRYLAAQKKVKAGTVSGVGAKICVERCEAYLHPTGKCPDGCDCTHTFPRFYQSITTNMGWNRCPGGGCCLKCNREPGDCAYRCKRSKEAIEAKKEQRKEEKSREEARLKKELDKNRAAMAEEYRRLADLADAAGLEDSEEINVPGARTVADLTRLAEDPSMIDYYYARDGRVFGGYTYSSTLTKTADKLGVSVDFLLGRTDESGRPAAAGTSSGGSAATFPVRGEGMGDGDGVDGAERVGSDPQIAPETAEGLRGDEGIAPYAGDGDGAETGLDPSAAAAAAPFAKGSQGADEIEARWIPGAPEALGRYMCLLRGNADGPDEPDKEFRVDVKEDGPYLFGRPILRGYIITAYWPLPPLGGAKEV